MFERRKKIKKELSEAFLRRKKIKKELSEAKEQRIQSNTFQWEIDQLRNQLRCSARGHVFMCIGRSRKYGKWGGDTLNSKGVFRCEDCGLVIERNLSWIERLAYRKLAGVYFHQSSALTESALDTYIKEEFPKTVQHELHLKSFRELIKGR